MGKRREGKNATLILIWTEKNLISRRKRVEASVKCILGSMKEFWNIKREMVGSVLH